MRAPGRVGVAACVLAVCGATQVSAQAEGVLRGRVVSAGTDRPVAHATVRSVPVSATAITSEDGAWRLAMPSGAEALVVEHPAFATLTVRIADLDAAATLRLTPQPVALNALVVTASRRLQQLKDVAVATELIGRDVIAGSGASDIAAVLTERTGIALEGGHPVGAGVMLQGLGSERVLVLVDGQPMIGRLSGSLDLSRMPTAGIDRVEVVKGPQSTLYGSDAMGGVVNIITRDPTRDGREASLSVTGGSNERLDLSGSVRGGGDVFGWSVDGGRRSIELVPGHAGTAGTYATRLDGAARMRWRIAPSFELTAGGLLLDERQRWSSGVLYNFADNTQWSARVGARHERGRRSLSTTLYATGFHHLARRSTLPQPVAGSGESEVQRLIEAELVYGLVIDAISVDAGIEARRESIRSDRVLGRDRVLHGVEPFVQATWSGDSWSVVPGARLSWSEQWGVHVTPRLAAMLRPHARIALRASVGRGFRAPSFKELYMEFLNTGAGAGYRVRGNPDLRPESSTNLTGGIEWSGERVYARVQAFYNRFDDFIETREVPDDGNVTLFAYGNVDDGETYGTDVELGATWGGLRAEAGYGWLGARDRSTGETLLGRAEHSARASLAWAWQFGLRAGLSAVHTGALPTSREADGTLVRRAALTRFDARIAQALPYGLELSAGVDNLFDAKIAGYPGHLGRQLYLGVGWTGSRPHAP